MNLILLLPRPPTLLTVHTHFPWSGPSGSVCGAGWQSAAAAGMGVARALGSGGTVVLPAAMAPQAQRLASPKPQSPSLLSETGSSTLDNAYKASGTLPGPPLPFSNPKRWWWLTPPPSSIFVCLFWVGFKRMKNLKLTQISTRAGI